MSLSLAAPMVILLAACSVQSKGDAAIPSAPATALAFAPPAAAVSPGVTDTEIKVGIAYPDFATVQKYIKVDHGDYKAAFTALIDKINAAGGIHGRKIVPVFGGIDVSSPAAADETCVKLTRDTTVFAVMGDINADEPLCYVQAQKTALVGAPLTAANYSKAKAPWFSYDQGGDKAAAVLKILADTGAFTGKKVAVVANSLDQNAVRTVVLPALKNLGVTPAEIGYLTVDTNDQSVYTKGASVFIQKIQAEGVDTVVVFGATTSQFPTQVAQTSYRPRLLFTDNNTAELYATSKDNAKYLPVLAGSATGGLVSEFTDPGITACAKTVEDAVPAARGLVVDPTTQPNGAAKWGIATGIACDDLTIFKAIAEKAGRTLTYESFQQAGFALGSLSIPSLPNAATYSRSTPSGAIAPSLYTFDPARGQFAPVS
ncbi:ABC transporter substrate-binding protein [Pseudofrankia inefficax]|uniref:ABC transporter substrate-binding protein n=1 Tax=Pseudofrankia inefficax (strain DSM 45817 / CECT 9037 / DDB 130130 / EuI1c) TaxID=298654 RepID=UPI001E33C045|nr:ABC transporter substrate-binding protein [Pseudofrankia inefficax]